MRSIYRESVTITFWGAFFWAPILFKHFQNATECGTVREKFLNIFEKFEKYPGNMVIVIVNQVVTS